ncbi:hypothetical protein [Halocalculus aciditolerans]|nr:hypothetical protein [Halocalculus aciditolerans]
MSEAATSTGECELCGASHGVVDADLPNRERPVPLCRSCRSLWGDAL